MDEPVEFPCLHRWDVFGLQCELARAHRGDHISMSGESGRIGQWGGRADYMSRVPAEVR